MGYDLKQKKRFNLFKKMIKNKMPYLTDEDIVYLATKRMRLAKKKAIILS